MRRSHSEPDPIDLEQLLSSFLNSRAHAYLLVADHLEQAIEFGHKLAKARLCDTNSAADDCLSCRLFDDGNHPDFKFVEKGRDNLITVDRIRQEVIASIYDHAQYRAGKVYMILADELNEQGQNALLKSLEEPPQAVCFLVLSTSPEKLLGTLSSRLEKIIMPRMPEQTLDIEFLAEVMNFFFRVRELSLAELLSRELDQLLGKKEEIASYLPILLDILADLAKLYIGLAVELRYETYRSAYEKFIAAIEQSDRDVIAQLDGAKQACLELDLALRYKLSLELALGNFLLNLKSSFE
ncbi:MAG: hypothetical protein Q4P65_01225 [Eubacteriales bacterium]|nr:hypothetical protein [Eubacteriales bacterium]